MQLPQEKDNACIQTEMESGPPGIDDEEFVSLLQPVLDLTKNTNFDLSRLLEGYIRHLRNNRDVTNMNFLQAATLVQNSVNIYGKKVDVLCLSGQKFNECLRKRQKNINSKPGEDTRVPERIVLNTSIKLKPKEGTSCAVYDIKGEEMGKKHEFRLHWRINADGLLSEEFATESKVIVKILDRCDETIIEEFHDDDIDGPNAASLLINGSRDVQDEPDVFEQPPSEEIVERNTLNRQINNVLNEEEVEKLQWQPAPPVVPVEELPTNKNKILKIPDEGKEDKKKKKKRAAEIKNILNKYDIIYMMLTDQHNNEKHFNFDEDLLHFQSKEHYLKKQEIMRRRIHFNEILAEEAKRDFCGDFLGFDGFEPDNVDDFAGFDDDNDGCDNNNVEVEVPLPDNALFHPNADDRVLENDTYEDEAQKALQEYRTQKKNYIDQMADLSKRVAFWHQIIQPKLEAAELRAHYDVHEYGTRILEHFPKSKGKITIPFAKVVTNEPPEEVARYFLSALMLANTYNVEISKTDPRDLAVDCMDLTLLSCVRHYEELDDNIRATSNNH